VRRKDQQYDSKSYFVLGVSGLDLCRSNCTWMDHYEEYLHPIDAGTDMGVRYNVNRLVIILSKLRNTI